MILVSNNQSRLVSIPVSKDKTLQLSPGANPIEDKDWEKVSDYQSVKREIELGNLEVLERVDKEGNPLPSMKAQDAAALIKRTVNPKLLAAWKPGETRKVVLDAFTYQERKLAEVSGKN
jgi:hypothetical protein